jgi:plasmid stability protein
MESSMATLTLKDVPADLHRKLKARAEQNGRSLNREVIESLEASFADAPVDVEAELAEIRALRDRIAAGTRFRITDREIDRAKRRGRT